MTNVTSENVNDLNDKRNEENETSEDVNNLNDKRKSEDVNDFNDTNKLLCQLFHVFLIGRF